MFPIEIWVVFFVIVASLTLFDLGLLARTSNAEEMPLKRATCTTITWVVLACIFACLIAYYSSWNKSALFITSYLIELALSIDNIFVFILLFSSFKLSSKEQHKVLMVGIFSAVIMRFLMISAGIYLVQSFQWIFYVFGTFLIYNGIKIIMDIYKKKEEHNPHNKLLEILKKFLPIYDGAPQNRFFILYNGKCCVTLLFVVMLLIEQADLVFALDSIPAILAITDDKFIVSTSNVFAILGLRSMYFFLSDIVEKFAYVKHALAIILSFIGLKMIAAVQGLHISITVSLLVILLSITTAIIVSIYKRAP